MSASIAKTIRKAETEGYESGALRARGARGRRVRRVYKKAAYNALARIAYREETEG